MLRVFSQSLGCPKNLVDTEHVLGSLGNIQMVENIDEAHFIFINTCAFISSAVEESIQTIVEIVEDVAGEIPYDLDGNPEVDAHFARPPFIAVCGCLVGRFGEKELSADLAEVNLWLDTDTIDSWGALTAKAVQEYFGITLAPKEKSVLFTMPSKKTLESQSSLNQTINNQHSQNQIDTPQLIEESPIYIPQAGRLLSTGPSYAWLKIGEGCRHRCSFCTIPSIRGRYRSVDANFLVPEAKKLVDNGVKELILVAQDVTAWGSDLTEKDLRPLLDKLFALDGLERLRLMYLYPAGMTKDLLKYLSQAGNTFVPYFDIPLQHAHEDILSKMGRPFSQNPEIVVDRIREYFPEAALRTTFIVGFPGETDAHFEKLYQFVNKTNFLQMGVFAYEKEDGTEAARMPNQVARKLKEARRNELMQLQAEISEELLEGYLGQRLPILIDAQHPEWPGLYVGRTWFQAPVVDGITYVSAPPEEEEIQIGKIIYADINETQHYDLVALT